MIRIASNTKPEPAGGWGSEQLVCVLVKRSARLAEWDNSRASSAPSCNMVLPEIILRVFHQTIHHIWALCNLQLPSGI